MKFGRAALETKMVEHFEHSTDDGRRRRTTEGRRSMGIL